MSEKLGLFERLFPRLGAKRAERLLQIRRAQVLRGLLESVPDWAQDDDEDEWQVLGSSSCGYTETDLQTLREQARSMYYTSPSARGVIETAVLFIVGRHAKVLAQDKSGKVQEYWDRW